MYLYSWKKEGAVSFSPDETVPSGSTEYSGSETMPLYTSVLAIPIAPATSSLSASNKILASMLTGGLLLLNLCVCIQCFILIPL